MHAFMYPSTQPARHPLHASSISPSPHPSIHSIHLCSHPSTHARIPESSRLSSIHLSIQPLHLFPHLCINTSTHLLCLPYIHPSICPFMCSLIHHPFTDTSIHKYVYSPTNLYSIPYVPIHTLTHPSVHPSTHVIVQKLIYLLSTTCRTLFLGLQDSGAVGTWYSSRERQTITKYVYTSGGDRCHFKKQRTRIESDGGALC